MDQQRIRKMFAAHFGRPADVVTRAPGRVNIIGEHTDYNDGYVLPMALEQNTWVACAPREDDSACVVSAELDDRQTWPLSAWDRATAPHWTSYVAGIAALLRVRGARLGGFDMLLTSEVPVGSGLSSSASLEVSTALALAQLAGEPIDARELADLCRTAEHEFAGVPCGIMDQYISVLGKADAALLLDCRSREYEHIPLALGDHTVLIVNSGVRHELAAGEYAKRQRECGVALEYFQKLQPEIKSLRDVTVEMVRRHAAQMNPAAAARALHVTSENERTLATAAALRHKDLAAVGPLLAESHRSLRDDYQVSCAELDMLVDIVSAVDGVVGARMTGGGFGGCIVAIASETCVENVAAELRRQYDTAGAAKSTIIQSRPGAGAAIEFAKEPGHGDC